MLSPLLSDYESTKWSEIEHPKLTPVTLIRFVERFPVAFEPQTTAVVHERLFKLYPYCTSSSRMSKKRGIFFGATGRPMSIPIHPGRFQGRMK